MVLNVLDWLLILKLIISLLQTETIKIHQNPVKFLLIDEILLIKTINFGFCILMFFRESFFNVNGH